MLVDVYKNLNRGCWSIRAHGGKVIAHVESCAIAGARFHVLKAAQAKIAAGAHRSVHAWVIGDLLESIPSAAAAVPVTYRPRDGASFIRRDNGAPVTSAAAVIFTADRGAIAIDPA